ncbi:hypothetical protein ACQPW1_10105 [Nocardia sp. CA-128927]|uniref:hypothetical protein n=1 Tax=Nocardia sp. CA-128927 TaxID=3239975 RepID=UPI003D97DDC4
MVKFETRAEVLEAIDEQGLAGAIEAGWLEPEHMPDSLMARAARKMRDAFYAYDSAATEFMNSLEAVEVVSRSA